MTNKRLVPAFAALLVLAACGKAEQPGPPEQGAPPVTVATPLVQQVVDWDE